MSYFQDNSSQYVVFSRFLLWAVASGLHSGILKTQNIVSIENTIYIREELNESLGMIFSVPSLKGSSKCTNHVSVHKLCAVEYINTVCSLDYSFQFRIF